MTRPRGSEPGHRALSRHGAALMTCLALALFGALGLGPSAAAVGLSTSAAVAGVAGDDDKCHPWEDWCQDDDKCHPWWKCDDDKKCKPWWKCDDDRSTAPRFRTVLS
jgi:hypothetical protein